MAEDTLITKYRPQDWDFVYGHTTACAAIQNALNKNIMRAFLFTGPTGIGKTTLAHLTAQHATARIHKERNAAEYASVDDMRNLLLELRHVPMFGENICIILNEVHGLSGKAWVSLLTALESPPSWLYWCLTSTEPTAIPDTVNNRCVRCDLKPLDVDDLIDLLSAINDAEGLQTPEDILALCARHAQGSPRLAISSLATVANAGSYEAAARALEESERPADAVELARILTKGGSWDQIQPILIRLADTNPESIRHTIRAYITKVILSNKMPDQSHFAILQAFGQPFHQHDGISPVVLAVSQLIFQ